jgi:hemolysin III
VKLRVSDRRPAAEEHANAITHAIGAMLSVAALIVLTTSAARGADVIRIVTVTIFGVALVVLYAASAYYHACPVGPRKRLLRVVDHAAIYVLIAATYTPILLVLMPGKLAWSLVGLLWVAALYGVTSKIRSVEQAPLRSTLLYIGMGWIGLLAIKPMFDVMPGGCLAWILAGGVMYTAGVIFYLWERLPFNHAIWHLFVTCGSVCHFVVILRYVAPVPG